MPKLAEGNVTIVQSFKCWLTPDYVPHIIVYKMRLREKKVYPLFFCIDMPIDLTISITLLQRPSAYATATSKRPPIGSQYQIIVLSY